MDVINKSAYKHCIFKKQGQTDWLDVLVVKATFSLRPTELVTLSEIQDDIILGDQFDGPMAPHPLKSVISSEGDLVAFKPETDLILTGTAESYRRQLCESWTAEISLGPISKLVRLCRPETFYRHSSQHPWVSRGVTPTNRVTLDDRLALGGCFAADVDDEQATCHFTPNPAGTGWLPQLDERSSLSTHQKEYVIAQCNEIQELNAPQIRQPGHAYHPDNTGGYINLTARPRWVSSRESWQGTYDRHWLTQQYPAYPRDFNPLYWQAVAEDQRANPWLKGDEVLTLNGLLSEGDRTFRLPNEGIIAVVTRADQQQVVMLPVLDTIRVDLDRRIINLVWRMHGRQQNPMTHVTLTNYPLNQLHGGLWS